METATAAATVPTIVPASNATTTTVITATNTINVNQSDSSHISHTNISVVSGSTSTTTSGGNSNSNSNTNINSSNSNSSSSSCSTSSNSSGYGSTTTTPTNNYETHQQQHTPTPVRTPTTPVAIAESPVIPVATVAAVTPYYNEAITTQNLEIQHQQQQQQQQQQYHHQQQQQQQQQHHLQQSFQHHQYLQRQQYYSPYDYQQQTAPNLSSPSSYNLGSGLPYDISSPAASASGPYVGGQYKSSSLSAINYERNPVAARPVGAASSIYTHQVHTNEQQPTNKTVHPTHQQQFAKQRTSTSLITSSNTSGSKPQAAATPFYAQPLSQHSNPATFYDNLKHKIPLEYHDTYTNPSSATYHQQQKYYAAAKSQLKEATYGSPALSSKSLYPNTTNFYSGSTVNHGYDKYMYPHASANAYSATGHLTNETSSDTSYRKTAAANSLSSPSWPWGIEYASGNSRTIPPPTTHLPTATVAPTHATYLPSNPSALSRDPYYMHHDKFNVKYDKYSAPACPPPYQQTYVSPPATRHHMWPSSHPGSQLTQLNERHHLATGPTAPPPHALHSSPYFSSNSGSSLNARQSCFSQPYQTQNCYYPTPNRLPLNQAPPPPTAAQSAAYMTGQQPNGQSGHLNTLSASCKYGGVVTDNVNKLKNPNDLYVTSHYDINNIPLNYGYGSNQIFDPNAHQSLSHQPSSASLTHEPLAANPASYTNDLNLTSSNYDSYPPAHHYDSHLSAAQSQQQPPQYAPTVAKRALLDYRKPIQPQPPPMGQQECYTTLTTANPRDHYNHQDLLNTPETTSAFAEYEVNQEVARITADAMAEAEKADEEENKNLSLRDFIANWNDDEDEYNNAEDLNFEQTAAVINEVLNEAAPLETEIQTTEIDLHKTLEVLKPVTLEDKPKSSDSLTKEALNDVQSDQYVNLPDIVIDIEKSNNANNSIAPTASGDVENTPSLILNNFDVEQELDQLKMQKDEEKLESTKDLNDIKDTCITTPQLSPIKSNTTQLSFEDLNLEQPAKTVSTSITSQTNSSNTDPPSTEQYLKDIEGYESGNSRHSNESAFEKEYETFIHKITSESTLKPTSSDSVKAFPETESDFEQNVQDFSKFYKRKRKLKEDELKSLTVVNQNTKKLKTNTVEIVNTSNFPQVYTKKSRNRHLKVKSNIKHKRKPLSAYYKIIHSLRRYRLFRIKRVRDYITELKEKHLPLIKRQSIKNYSHSGQEVSYNPNSLKTLSILAINTEEFRQRLMLDLEATRDDSLKSEEKHICTDPTCETCEVIKSLMVEVEDDLYQNPESLISTAPLLLGVIPEDVEHIIVAKEVEADGSLVSISNESHFETLVGDSDNSAQLLAVLVTASIETSLSPPQEECLLISDKSDHQISEPAQFLLTEICNNSINNKVETNHEHLKSPTPPDMESSFESKDLLSPQINYLDVRENVKDNSEDQIENHTDLEVVPEKMESPRRKDEKFEDSNIDLNTTKNSLETPLALEVVPDKMDSPRQKDEKFEDSNIDFNTLDNSLETPMNLKINTKFCEEDLEPTILEDTKLSNQSQQQSDTIKDNESFQNTSVCLKSLENSNVNEDLIETDLNTDFEKESQSIENVGTESKPEDIFISSNSEEKKYTEDDNKEESAIKTISTGPNNDVQYEKDDSDSSESDSSSDSDSDSSSDSSDEYTEDNKESRQINTDTDSSSSSDSSSESEDEKSEDNNKNPITVKEDSTKEAECKILRKSPIPRIDDKDSEMKEFNTKNNSSDSESNTDDENSLDNNINRTVNENVEDLTKGSESETSPKSSIQLDSDSTKEAECETIQKSPLQHIIDTVSETKELNTKNISSDSGSNTEDENSLDNNINRITARENINHSIKESDCETSPKSSIQPDSETNELNTTNIPQLTLRENILKSSRRSSESQSVTENSLDNNINRITVGENVVNSTQKSECITSLKSPVPLNNDTDSEMKESNTKNNSLGENIVQISKGSLKSFTEIKDSQTSLEPLEIHNSDSEWDDESDEESIQLISESETRSSCNSPLKLTIKKQNLNSPKSFKESKNLKLSNDDSRLSQSNLENISVTIIENKIGDNKIRLKFTTQVVDKDTKDTKVKESDSDSQYDYDSETDDDDIDMEGNKRWKGANDTSQVLRASQTLLQNTLEFLHTSESSQHKSNLSQTNQKMPLDFLKSAKDPEESNGDSETNQLKSLDFLKSTKDPKESKAVVETNQRKPLAFLKSAKDPAESKSDSIVISDDEMDNIDEDATENLQSCLDRLKSNADLTVICNEEDQISQKITGNFESHENVSKAKNSEEVIIPRNFESHEKFSEAKNSVEVISDNEDQISTRIPENFESYENLSEVKNSEEACAGVSKDSFNDSVNSPIDNSNQNDEESNLLSRIEDSQNNSITSQERNLSVSMTPENISNIYKVEIQTDSCEEQQHENASKSKSSEKDCDEVNKEFLNESLYSPIDNLNQNDEESQLLSGIEDSQNNSTIAKESKLSNVDRAEIQAEQTIENELIHSTRSEISTKDLVPIEELKQDSETIGVVDLSLPSPSSLAENIPEEKEENLEVPEILTQNTINEMSNCSVESERIKCLTETSESHKEENEESLEDSNVNDCVSNNLTEEASSNRKNIVEYDFSEESDNSNDSFITQQTINTKAIEYSEVSESHNQCSENMPIENEDKVENIETNENTNDFTDKSIVKSPLQQFETENNQSILNISECSETTETVNKFIDEPKEELSTEKFEHKKKCATEPHLPDFSNDAENCETNYVNPETNAESSNDFENESDDEEKEKHISENLIASEPPTNVEIHSVNLQSDSEKEDFEITQNKKVTDQPALSNINIKENLISGNMNPESLIASPRIEGNVNAPKSISDSLNEDNSNNSETNEFIFESDGDIAMLDKADSKSTIRDSENHSFEVREENVTDNKTSDIMEEESEQNDNISEYTTTKNSEQNDSNLELSDDESEISKMDINNDKSDIPVSETSLSSSDQTLSHETEQDNITSPSTRDDNISETLVEEFHLNEIPKEIIDKESELIEDILEHSNNSSLVSEQEPELNKTSPIIADRTLSNETETDSPPTKDDEDIYKTLTKDWETDHTNTDTEPTSDDDDIPNALPKERMINESPREIIEEHEFDDDISEYSSNSCEGSIIKASSCLPVSEPEPETPREVIEEYELDDDISENSSNSCEGNIIKAASCLLVSEPEPQLNETSPNNDDRILCNENVETEEYHKNSEARRDSEIYETKTKEFNDTSSESMLKESELAADIPERSSLSHEGNIIEADTNTHVSENEPEWNETSSTNILNSEQESELHETSSILDNRSLSNESEENNTKLESKKDNEISEITRESTDEEFELNDNSEPSINSVGAESTQEPLVNETCSESTIDDQTLSKESDQNNTIPDSTRDDEITETQNNTNMESTRDNEIFETLGEELTFSETKRATTDEEFEISEITREKTVVEFEQHAVNSESSSNSHEIESNIQVTKQEPSRNKSVLNELSSESCTDCPNLNNESEQTNPNSEPTRDDEMLETLDKEFSINETTKDHIFSETHIETLAESTANNQTSEVLNTESELNETLNKNRSSEIQNQDPELISTTSEPRNEDLFLETKESSQNPASEKLDQETSANSIRENSENIQPNLSTPITVKESTTEDLSEDFYGFKNQSSFEDESGDFHGFEDMEEERRIRREIESLNEDSTANDGFVHSTLNKESHTTSKTSLAESTTSEINELEALEKELSQHQVDEKLLEEDEIETDTNIINATNKIISTNDIEHIKQMLESDEEPQQDEAECHPKSKATEAIEKSKAAQELPDSSKSKSSSSREILQIKTSVIPKLSDLCRAALNSSLHNNNSTNVQNVPDQIHNDDDDIVEREVTVEEAFAEMYRQAGVLLSDPEDCDNDLPKTNTFYNNVEAQDVLLFNLQEILNSDNDVYVLQCDINDKILNVVEKTNDDVNVKAIETSLEENTERVNTLQFIGIQVDTENSETQIHILSSDSESEVIILSDDDNESFYEPVLTTPRQERVSIPFINDSEFNNDSLSDISTIHHEEIVPDNLNKFLQEEFYKYLHEKYVQRNISKYFYANRVLKKYKNRYVKKSRQ